MGTVIRSNSYSEPTSKASKSSGPTITCSIASFARSFAAIVSVWASESPANQYFLNVRTA